MSIKWPYRREVRPSLPESLGEHTDREYEKIERAFKGLQDRIDNIVDQNTLTE